MEKWSPTRKRMVVVKFGIKSLEEGFRGVAAAFEAARTGKPFKPERGTYFTSLEAARNFLTPNRIEMLKTIKAHEPHSVYALAKLAKRDFASVLRDLQTLRRHGLVRFSRAKDSKRRTVRPLVDYDAIQLHIPI